MTRKDYVAIAKVIKNERQQQAHIINSGRAQATAMHIAEDLADYLATDNSHFDRERFLEACGGVVVA